MELKVKDSARMILEIIPLTGLSHGGRNCFLHAQFSDLPVLNSTNTLNPRSLGMPGRNCGYVLRSMCEFFVVLLSLVLFSLNLLAQTPATGVTPQTGLPENQNSSTQSSPQTWRPLPNSNTKLGVGDLIEVVVFGVPDLSTKTRISGSGDVYLPLIDYVHVADLTTDEAQGLIQKRLEDGGFVRGPHVSIFVDESASQAITLIGEVGHPGQYPSTGERRLFDVISAAGGLTDKAGRNVTIEHRGTPGEKVELRLSSNLAEDTKDNVDVFPGDTIIVSRAGIVYVVGDVNRPSGFMIEDINLSVLKALALAGGSTRTAALNRTKILRQTPNGVQEIPINLKKVLYNKAPDVTMVKGDVLFIPGSAAKAAAYRTGEAALSMSTTLAVVAVHP
jgi:polysaccharide biosynthesis/export protein